MEKRSQFDMCYVTVDSISEGVGSSQITPLLKLLSSNGMSISLISFEKEPPSNDSIQDMENSRIDWNPFIFKAKNGFEFVNRLNQMRTQIPNCNVIHARSDLPTFSAILSGQAPVLWDVRSLWSDQKAFMEPNRLKGNVIRQFKIIENIASAQSVGLSTLTHAIVPILAARHRTLPKYRTVVPTAVDLSRFRFSSKIPKPFMGLYSGTYSNYYDLSCSKNFIDVLSSLSSIDVHWARPAESAHRSLSAGESKVFTLKQEKMAEIISNYAFGISICKSNAGDSLSAAVPTKIGEFLASGRPVVVNAGLGDMDDYLKEFNAGITIEPNNLNLDTSAKKLLGLLNDPETPYRCRALAEKYFDIASGAKNYMSLYSQMLS